MHEGFATAAIIAAIALPGCPALVFVYWFAMKQTAQDRALKHAERLKAMELGQPLPDLEIAQLKAANENLAAQVTAVNNRLGAVCFLAFFVPLIMVGAAIGGTALVLAQAAASLHLPLLCTMWGVCGIVSLACLVPVILVLAQKRGLPSQDQGSVAPDLVPELRASGIQERPSIM